MRIIRVYVFILSYFICIQSLLAIENNYFINPQLIRLLLDPGLLTPWKIAEIDSIINLELDEIKQIYKTAEANSNIYTSNYSLNLVFNYADTIVNSIDKTITSLNESRLIDSNNMTEIFIIGGSLEGLYQYLKFKEKNNRPKVHWNFLPISRLGFSELDPKGFRDYMRKRFFNLLKENKNIIFFDTYCNGETLGFVSTVISKIILEMRKSSSFPLSKVALIGMTEYNGELRKKENSFEQFNLYQNKFYSSNSSKLPILKISGNKQSLPHRFCWLCFSALWPGRIYRARRRHSDTVRVPSYSLGLVMFRLQRS